ncbi:hypothetical protein BDA96_01G061400 [Sorghum bicolor]|uniref:Uncharacterized protein n=1 Tax=Sorghum bicolor TaxID=4558 RepID=A0A921UW79_SORBI|nr:hypothetical protein BDA96_01G061400 [Sorghum bicolor]
MWFDARWLHYCSDGSGSFFLTWRGVGHPRGRYGPARGPRCTAPYDRGRRELPCRARWRASPACSAGRQFLPLGRGVDKIVGVDRHRHTVIFDTRTAAVRAGPDVRHVKWHYHGSTWAEAGGRLFHLGRGPGYEVQECLDFEALTYDHHREDWFWSLLPSPPFERYTNVPIESFADAGAGEAGAGDASAIRISAWNSTYAFDAARASWRKEGD